MSESTLRLPRRQSGRLLGEGEAIEYLGLGGRANPRGALRWLMRVRRVAYVKLAKGIYGFTEPDLDAFIAQQRVPACRPPAGSGRAGKPAKENLENVVSDT